MYLKHFELSEFSCPCCGKNEMEPAFLLLLDAARDMTDAPFIINSGYRCRTHNKRVNGEPNSSHLVGWAADIRVPSSRMRYEILWALIQKGFQRIGIGSNFIHVDDDPKNPPEMIWVYSYLRLWEKIRRCISMKKLFLISISLSLILGFSVASYAGWVFVDPKTMKQVEPPGQEEMGGTCPKTMVKGKLDDCLRCHTYPSMKIKETAPDEGLSYPVANMWIRGTTATMVITEIASENVVKFFDYISWHEPKIDRVVFELYSPGGSMMGAIRIISMMREKILEGMIIETRLYGAAMSAGFMVFVSGTKGYRIVSPLALLMWHEVWNLSWFKLTTPSGAEEEARIYRLFQDNMNEWLQSVSNMTKEKIDQKVKFKEFWMTGKQALEFGFADGFPEQN